jgi:hypothetical protein
MCKVVFLNYSNTDYVTGTHTLAMAENAMLKQEISSKSSFVTNEGDYSVK